MNILEFKLAQIVLLLVSLASLITFALKLYKLVIVDQNVSCRN